MKYTLPLLLLLPFFSAQARSLEASECRNIRDYTYYLAEIVEAGTLKADLIRDVREANTNIEPYILKLLVRVVNRLYSHPATALEQGKAIYFACLESQGNLEAYLGEET